MRVWAHTALSVLLGAASLGCAGNHEAPTDDPSVDVGQGVATFTPIEAGDPIEMVFGTQGRWHIDLAGRFMRTAPADHIAMYRVWDLDRQEQVTYPTRMFVPEGEIAAYPSDTFEQLGVRAVFAIASADEVRNQDWLVEIEVVVGKDVFVDERIVRVVDELP